MSNLEAGTPPEDATQSVINTPLLLDPRRVKLTTRSGVTIERTLPHKDLKKIGAWCFLDSYGPTSEPGAMRVAAHPHTGLQTVTWLFSGTVIHNDSLGSRSTIQPGELNLMTAGHGIAHSELSLESDAPLQGVQLWVVLPGSSRDRKPDFRHYRNLPRFSHDGAEITLFMGELLGRRSEATTHSPIVGAQIQNSERESVIPINKDWEHGILAVTDQVHIDGIAMKKDQLLYFPPGKESFSFYGNPESSDLETMIVIGGAPFEEKFVMWWNFIGRSHEEIVAMRNEWQYSSDRFPQFSDSIHQRIPAPELPNLRLTPR